MFITSGIRAVQSMAKGTRVRELQQQMESAKGLWEISQSQQAQMQSQQTQMQNQINQHGVDIKDLSSKMDQLLEVMLARNSVPGMETLAFVQQGPLEGRHSREMGESSFGFSKTRFGNGLDIQVRNLKLEFPHFDGKNVSSWLFKVKQFFDFSNVPTEYKIPMALFYMEGDALVWFRNASALGLLDSWEALEQVIQLRFGPNSMQELVHEFENEEAMHEQIKRVEPDRSLLDLKPKGVLQDDVEESIIALSTVIRVMEEWPLMVETKQKEPIQIWSSLGVDNAQNQEIKIEDMLEQDVGNFFVVREELYCDAENVFVKKLERNLEDGIFFLWCGKWSFDPGITNHLPTLIPPLIQPLKMRHNIFVLSSFVFQSVTENCVIFLMWKHRWRWKSSWWRPPWGTENWVRFQQLNRWHMVVKKG
jgi:hypothetical protein